MTESPLKEKKKQSFIENDRIHKELSVAIDNWTASSDRFYKCLGDGLDRIVKKTEETTCILSLGLIGCYRR